MSNEQPVLLKGVKLGGEADFLRSTYRAMKTADIEHERIHAGRMFEHSEVHSLASGATYTHLIVPTSGSADLHLRQVDFSSDGSGLLRLLENPYTNVASLGTVVTSDWLNMHRGSSNVLPAVMYGGTFINVASAGVQLFAKTVNATGVGPASAGEASGVTREYVLDSTKVYAIHFANESNGAARGNANFIIYDASES